MPRVAAGSSRRRIAGAAIGSKGIRL